jgi:hypothetical protein
VEEEADNRTDVRKESREVDDGRDKLERCVTKKRERRVVRRWVRCRVKLEGKTGFWKGAGQEITSR